jgi:DNA-binding FrmR family transcriptional regulator
MLNTAMDGQEIKDLVVSLNRIDGQLGGIRRMVEDAKPCIDILQQTRAVEAAVRKLSVTIFRAYVHSYVMTQTGEQSTESHMALDELRAILADRFKAL